MKEYATEKEREKKKKKRTRLRLLNPLPLLFPTIMASWAIP